MMNVSEMQDLEKPGHFIQTWSKKKKKKKKKKIRILWWFEYIKNAFIGAAILNI